MEYQDAIDIAERGARRTHKPHRVCDIDGDYFVLLPGEVLPPGCVVVVLTVVREQRAKVIR